MHKSRLGGLIIDCQTDDLDSAGEFWSKALGLQIKASNAQYDEKYVLLNTAENELDIEVQQVTHDSRVHIDIETNDIEAEASRLEKLGARRIDKVDHWVVMQAPTGQRFCLVKPQRSEFESQANIWE